MLEEQNEHVDEIILSNTVHSRVLLGSCELVVVALLIILTGNLHADEITFACEKRYDLSGTQET